MLNTVMYHCLLGLILPLTASRSYSHIHYIVVVFTAIHCFLNLKQEGGAQRDQQIMAQAPTPLTTPIVPTQDDKPQTFELEAEHELRFEIPPDLDGATLMLETGSAEMFGIELAHNRSYPLRPGLNAAVFTWHGATVLLDVTKKSSNIIKTEGSDTNTSSSSPSSVMAYTATNTPMPSYINAHAVLQSKREMAKSANLPGPRAIVVGTKDCGKTALVNILSAYSVKANGNAIVIDADPSSSGAVGIMPGAIALSIVNHLDLDVDGVMHENVVPIMLGHTSPRQNLTVSEAGFQSMGKLLDDILSTKSLKPYVGCIIDTCGDVESKDGTEMVINTIKSMKADVVFVLGSERLYASVRSTFDENNAATETVLLNKSGGVVSRDQTTRMAMQSNKVREYFYGLGNMYNPFSSVMDFEEVKVFKVGGVLSQLSDSLLPVGAESSIDPLAPVTLTNLHDLLHKVLGVSQAESEQDVVRAPLYGFVHVVRVNPEKNTMTVLAPSSGKIPGRLLVAGDIKWIDV